MRTYDKIDIDYQKIMDIGYINRQIDLVKEAIANGTILRDSPLIQEQIENIIDSEYKRIVSKNIIGIVSKSEIGLIIDKMFADKLQLE